MQHMLWHVMYVHTYKLHTYGCQEICSTSSCIILRVDVLAVCFLHGDHSQSFRTAILSSDATVINMLVTYSNCTLVEFPSGSDMVLIADLLTYVCK